MKKPRGFKTQTSVHGGKFTTAPGVLRGFFGKCKTKMEGERVEISVTVISQKRSIRQNAYYWGCVVEMLTAALNDLGNNINSEQCHEWLKGKFLEGERFINPETGAIETVVPSTTKLKKDEFGEYIDSIKNWAGMYLNLDIPEPEGMEVLPVF